MAGSKQVQALDTRSITSGHPPLANLTTCHTASVHQLPPGVGGGGIHIPYDSVPSVHEARRLCTLIGRRSARVACAGGATVAIASCLRHRSILSSHTPLGALGLMPVSRLALALAPFTMLQGCGAAPSARVCESDATDCANAVC